jgi:hypothetical protein
MRRSHTSRAEHASSAPAHSQGFEIRTFFTIGRQDAPYYM